MLNKRIILYLCLAGVAAVLAVHAVDSPAQVPAKAEARLRAIFEQGEFNAKSVRATWLRDGSGYMVQEAVPGANEWALVCYDAASGKRTVLASPSQLVPPGATEPLAIEGYELSADGGWLLLQTGRGGRRGRVADYWVLERKSGTLRKLVAGVRKSTALERQRFICSDQGTL